MSDNDELINLYNFPYEPYPQQIKLMNEIYKAINERKFGIFESPTGTGKSLSVLCSSLFWILKNEENETNRLKEIKQKLKEAEEKSKNDFDWIKAFDNKRKLNLEINEEIEKLEKKNKILTEISQIRRKRKILDKENICTNIFTKDYICEDWLVDYESDDDMIDDENGVESGNITKVFYCSRTHSQLSQVIKELKKTVYSKKIVVSSLGSRQNLCINKSVNTLKSINLINEKCLDLQQKQSQSKQLKATSKVCSFKTSSKIVEMSQEIIKNTMDIEDLSLKGVMINACPFYGIRQTINKSHLVLLPYQNVLNPAARAASSIDLSDNVVIIDEAHNLADNISSINSVTITLANIQVSRQQIDGYINKYISRLSDKNMWYLRQIVAILKNLEKFIKSSSTLSMDCTDFIFKAYINNFKLDQILKYLDKSKLAFKLRGSLKDLLSHREDIIINKTFPNLFTKEKEESLQEAGSYSDSMNAILIFKNFISAIVYGLDAKILSIKDVSLRFLVVDPGKYLADIIKQCRSLVVIGGTMQPFHEFVDRLLKVAGCPDERIMTFSCDHIVDAQRQMRVMTLGCGPEGEKLKFTFEGRSNQAMMNVTGKVIYSILNTCPNGAIVFFASYDSMENMLAVWKTSKVYTNIESIKASFIEPRLSSKLDTVMRCYSSAARSSKGSVLFAVIGGKMSEGINFDDELARVVIVVGVPFPQIKDVTLQEKKRFIESKFGIKVGKDMYHNLALKAVNQAIGRAIRHKYDYAAVLLLDSRYELISRIRDDEKCRLGLPKWMREAVSNHNSVSSVIENLSTFFREIK